MQVGDAMRGKLVEVDGDVQVKNRLGFYCWFQPEGVEGTYQTLPIVVVNAICEHIAGKRVVVIKREQYIEVVEEIK